MSFLWYNNNENLFADLGEVFLSWKYSVPLKCQESTQMLTVLQLIR